ncbi:uncharacterized protein LOC135820599 [Sycon ciliatum]|uniref:uncharacterized protein LOC135820599 n=1 Tax=Sycon ciliatum TaxID=27933 RepID=UPI0031F693AF
MHVTSAATGVTVAQAKQACAAQNMEVFQHQYWSQFFQQTCFSIRMKIFDTLHINTTLLLQSGSSYRFSFRSNSGQISSSADSFICAREINECTAAGSASPCYPPRQCQNTFFSYECVCPGGTTWNGVQCLQGPSRLTTSVGLRFCTHITGHSQTGYDWVIIGSVSTKPVSYEVAKSMCTKEKMQLLAPELSWCATTDDSSPYRGYNAWLKFEGFPGERIVSNIGKVSMNTPTLYRALCFKVACFVPAIANGGTYYTFILKDDQLTYTCNTGFSRPPSIDTTCLANGTLREAPSCNLICTRVSDDQTRTQVIIQAVSPNKVSYEVAKGMCANKQMQLLASELSWCATTNGASPYRGYEAWLKYDSPYQSIVSNKGFISKNPADLYRAICFTTLPNGG